jgi:hypothetical protein
MYVVSKPLPKPNAMFSGAASSRPLDLKLGEERKS